MPSHKKTPPYSKSYLCIAFFAITLLYISSLVSLSPQFPKHGTYSFVGSEEKSTFIYPLLVWKDLTWINIELPFFIKKIHPHYLTFVPDNCLDSLEINGNTISIRNACNWQHGHTFYVKEYLHPGENILRASIYNSNRESGLEIRVPLWDPMFSVLHILYGLIVIIILTKIIPPQFLHKHAPVILIGGLGVFLRLVYLLSTPYKIRSYDALGHLEYVSYVLKYLTIPPANESWEFFQPPLYYFLCYPLGKFIELLGGSNTVIIFALQSQSLLISIGTMVIGFLIAKKLFPTAKDKIFFYLFCTIVGTYPGLIFLASRISNDVLLAFLEFCFLFVLLSWWKEKQQPRRNRQLLIISIITAFGILTKANAIPLLGVSFLCILLKEESWHARIRAVVLCLSTIILCTWWFAFGRILLESQNHIVGNISLNNHLLQIQNFSIWNFFVFRPLHILSYPFNSSWVDTFGRPFYWEHLLKSTIVGEWNFGFATHPFARLFFVSTLILAIYVIWSFVRSIHSWRDNTPLLSVAVFLIASQIYLLIDTKIGGFADYRYVTILLFPFFYYALQGIRQSRGVFRYIGYYTIYTLIIASLLFLHTVMFTLRGVI